MHTAYYKALAADLAWQKELERRFGSKASDKRYTVEGRSGLKLSRLYSAFRQASDAARNPRGVWTSKEERMYRQILRSGKGRYGRRAKQVAARTVMARRSKRRFRVNWKGHKTKWSTLRNRYGDKRANQIWRSRKKLKGGTQFRARRRLKG